MIAPAERGELSPGVIALGRKTACHSVNEAPDTEIERLLKAVMTATQYDRIVRKHRTGYKHYAFHSLTRPAFGHCCCAEADAADNRHRRHRSSMPKRVGCVFAALNERHHTRSEWICRTATGKSYFACHSRTGRVAIASGILKVNQVYFTAEGKPRPLSLHSDRTYHTREKYAYLCPPRIF